MIRLPERGLSGSIEERNIDWDVLCDWIEGSVLFLNEPLSQIDVVDVLLEEERCTNRYQAQTSSGSSQDIVSALVQDAWLEIERRSGLCADSYGLRTEGDWLHPTGHWRKTPEHAFCLLLSLASRYDWWFRVFGTDYSEQGELFELLTAEALRAIEPGWDTFRAGSGPTNKLGLRLLLEEIASRIDARVGDVSLWDTENTGDMQLDLLWHMTFPDQRGGVPYCLIQCASGSNWESKIQTPNLSLWESSLLNSATKPIRGCSVPFCYSDNEDFKRNCVKVGGLFLDRCRLLGAARWKSDWVPESVAQRIKKWTLPRVAVLIERSQ